MNWKDAVKLLALTGLDMTFSIYFPPRYRWETTFWFTINKICIAMLVAVFILIVLTMALSLIKENRKLEEFVAKVWLGMQALIAVVEIIVVHVRGGIFMLFSKALLRVIAYRLAVVASVHWVYENSTFNNGKLSHRASE